MPIYEAEFLGEPVPIKKVKKPKAPKTVKAPPTELAPTPESKPKPIRKRKAPEPKNAPAVEVQVATPPPSEASVSEAPPKKKRVVKPKPVVEEEDKPEPPKKISKKEAAKANKKIIVSGDVADEPPSWFKAYLHEEQKRRNADKPKKERASAPAVKQAAEVQAAVKWSDGLTRDRVNNEVNGHMNRLYAQIHGRR